MGTKCEFVNGKQIFSGDAQFISGGKIEANVQVVNTATETALISETIYGKTLKSAKMHFRVTLGGEISSDGAKDIVLTLRYGTTDILALTTVSLPNEDDKQWKAVFEGRVHTVGASGKIVAAGRLENEMTAMADVVLDTAAAGVSVDLTADGSLNVTAHWDGAHGDADIIAMYGFIEFFN